MRYARGRDLDSRGLERLILGVLPQLERLAEHSLDPELVGELLQLALAARRQPELRLGNVAARAVQRSERPRNEIAPVVEVEVRDRDRVDARPAFLLSQARQDAGPAVEQQARRPFDEIARLRPGWVGPGRRASDDDDSHLGKSHL